MDGRWEYDHEYFQQIIEREQRVNTETIGAVVTNLYEVIQSNSSSKDLSISGLQETAREDLSSNDDTDVYNKDGIYDNDELWGYKTLTLS